MTPTVLDRYPPNERPQAPLTPLGSAGGLSGSVLWRYTASNGPRVLRRWPPPTAIDRVRRVHRWLLAADLPFIPHPIATSDGATVVEADGALWELVPWLPGEADPEPRPERIAAGFRGLSEFHLRLERRDARIGPSPGLASRRDELRALIAGGLDLLATALAATPTRPGAADARDWLRAARDLAPVALATATSAARLVLPLQPVLRDARGEHFLFRDDLLTGLVDFGAMDVESPAADLARLLGDWSGPDPDEERRRLARSSYSALRPLAEPEALAATAFEETADVLIGERWVRWTFLENRRFGAEAVASGLARGLARIRRLAIRRLRP